MPMTGSMSMDTLTLYRSIIEAAMAEVKVLAPPEQCGVRYCAIEDRGSGHYLMY